MSLNIEAMKIIDGYRLNVAMIVKNMTNEVLFCRRRNSENWQFPQGGVDKGEDILKAMYRELEEEVGLKKESVHLIGESKELIYYDIPRSIRSNVLGGRFKGQAQRYFLLETDSLEVKLNQQNPPEFDSFEWVPYWYPLFKIVEFKKEAYRKALSEFRYYFR